MKTLELRGMPKSAQAGFTIIELIVVILLLGILTATALPRFLDVTDEAHDAVVSAVQGGLATGMALFRAQWVAEGEPADTAIAEFNSMEANTSGYPIGLDGDDDEALSDNTECLEIFEGLLQEGRPTANEDSAESTAATIDATNFGNVTTDFLAQFTAANTCSYAYLGQDRVFGTVPGNPVIDVNVSTGAVTLRGTEL
ncbi:MAG: hypothetical protein PsegKO_15120 [Pseudohongiellaceae bacterium]